MGRLRRWLGLGCAAVAWSVGPPCALAGNDEGVLIGSQAVLTGGAVTAIVSDGTSAWYNPAGLATLERATFDIDGSTYGISYNTTDNMLTLPDGTQSSASVVDWQLIPTALSYARRLGGKVVGAFGVFIPHAVDSDLRAEVKLSDGSTYFFGYDNLRNDYSYILSVAVKTNETFRWGVALHGVFIENEEMTQVGFGNSAQNGSPHLVSSEHTQIDDYGLRVGLGLQWLPVPRFALGLSLQTPLLTGFREISDDRISAINASSGEPAYDSYHEADWKGVWEFSTPLLVRLGGAFTAGRVQWLLDGSLTTPLDSSERAFDRALSGNARAACLITLSDELTLGTGLFTDLNPQRHLGVDFLGGVLGLKFAESYHLRENGNPLTFSTTLGVRYAYGWGRTQGVVISDLDITQAELAVIDVRLRVHEAAINLAAGVSY
jgi:hypothetical protein